jgi:rod shape determining protein RodA
MNLDLQVENRSPTKNLDTNFALVILALNIIGLINLYSATHGAHDTSIKLTGPFLSQIVWIVGGWGIFFFATYVDYRVFARMSYIFYAINVVALAAVPFIGHTSLGAQRWINLGFFQYQPSETMKLALVLILARILAKKTREDGMGFKELILPLIVTAIPFILVVRQPDLGTAIMITAIAFSMILFVGVKRRILISSIIIGLVIVPVAWQFGLKDYQKRRVLTFVDPSRDPRGAGYNSIQSKIAVGSGGVLGKGFRKGTQSQLEFLPERHTDFIFSVLSEEHGFIGSMTTIGLFTVLFLLGVRTSMQAYDKVGALLVVGVLSMIFWHMFVNIGMVIGLLPIVGIPLPLLSYGGSMMLTTMLGLGWISSVAIRKYFF